jgi:hypothetical protein
MRVTTRATAMCSRMVAGPTKQMLQRAVAQKSHQFAILRRCQFSGTTARVGGLMPSKGHEGGSMRDIRGDLQERADLLAKQIGAVQEQFDKLLEQLKNEHATRLNDLKSGLDTVRLVFRIEDRRAGSPSPETNMRDLPRLQVGQSRPDLAHRVAAASVR